MNPLRLAGFLILLLQISPGVRATGSLDGYLIAARDCPAFSSIQRQRNPGDVKLVPQRAYPVIGKNKPAATHLLIRIDEANPAQRWVAVSCGELLVDCRETESTAPGPDANTPTRPAPHPSGNNVNEYVLAVSWQPAFCETHHSKPECESQTKQRYDASHLALHGLWPQPRGNEYCGVSSRDMDFDKNGAWNRLPALELSDRTTAELALVMPGVVSHLDRHEWIKHGTCYGEPAQSYIQDALGLMDQLNKSAVRELISGNIGKRVTARQIRAAFDTAFGPGSGDRVAVRCDNGLIVELRINLRGDIDPESSLSKLLQAGSITAAGCNGGEVDPAGFGN